MSAVNVEIDAETRVEWWRPLVHWFLAIPHLVWTGMLAIASGAVAVVTAVVVVVTGTVPSRLAAFQVLTLRERARAYSYFFCLRASYPPLATDVVALDPGDDDCVRVSAQPAARAPRWAPLVRPFVLLPHAIALLPLGVLMDVLYPIEMALVAAHRGWPRPWADRLVAVDRWVVSVLLYATFAIDTPPRFGLTANLEPPMSMEDGQAAIDELIDRTDEAGGPSVADLAEEILAVVATAHQEIANVLAGHDDKTLATMLFVSRQGTSASLAATQSGVDDPRQWQLHAASTLLSGFVTARATRGAPAD